MDYESFVAYCCIAILIVITVSFLYWIEKNGRESIKRREELERERKAIEESIRRQRANEVVEKSYSPTNDGYGSLKSGSCVSSHPKPKKAIPKWWRFLTEETIRSLMEKSRQKRAENRKNDPWSS